MNVKYANTYVGFNDQTKAAVDTITHVISLQVGATDGYKPSEAQGGHQNTGVTEALKTPVLLCGISHSVESWVESAWSFH